MKFPKEDKETTFLNVIKRKPNSPIASCCLLLKEAPVDCKAKRQETYLTGRDLCVKNARCSSSVQV